MPTIADVAKLAGVSPGTVSRVMNGAMNVNPDTRTKVELAISKLGYQPNFQARSLRSKRTDTIALAIPELTNYFWTTVARGVQDAAQANGYHVIICNTYARSRQNLRYLESIYGRVDGMILSRRSEWMALAGDEHASRQSMDSREKPIVFVGQSQAARWYVDNVYSDSVSGAFALTQHLIELGHRKIAVVTGRQSSTSASDRVLGYCMALADACIPIDQQRICWGEYERDTAERLTHDLMERLPDTSAIVASNNEIAIGVINALEKQHIAVPERVAVVCFDDFYPDSRFASFMTVASQAPYDIGVNATQLLLKRLTSDDYSRPQTVVLPSRLIIRQSSGGVPNTVDVNSSFENVQGQLIAPLPREKIMALANDIGMVAQVTLPPGDGDMMQVHKAEVNLLKQVLRHETVDETHLPHFEYSIHNDALYRYVLEHEPHYEFVNRAPMVTPEDQIGFAQRSGIAAIACRFPHHVTIDSNQTGDSDTLPFDFPLLTDQIDFFDHYVRAARSTNVGIAADFRGIVADTLTLYEALHSTHAELQPSIVQKIANTLFDYQSKVMQLICDRFGTDLAFVILSDDLANEHGLRFPVDVFNSVFCKHIQQMVRIAHEHDLSTVLYSRGKIDALMNLISDLGFDGLYIAQPEANNLGAVKPAAVGRLGLLGGIPCSLLAHGEDEAIVKHVAAAVSFLASGGGYVGGVSAEITDNIPVKNFFSYLRALPNGKA